MSAQEFHIHVDGQEHILEPHRTWFFSQGFIPDQFVPVDMDPGFEPHDHLSFETFDKAAYEQLLRATMDYLKAHPDALVGYVESEAIVNSVRLNETPFNPEVPLPSRLLIQPAAEVLEVVPDDWFRQSEMHFSTRKDRTDPRLIEALKEIGLYTAHYKSSVDKALYIIFTVQGYQREIARLEPMLRRYLEDAGGHSNGCLQLEVVTASWKSAPSIPLPPIVHPRSFGE